MFISSSLVQQSICIQHEHISFDLLYETNEEIWNRVDSLVFVQTAVRCSTVYTACQIRLPLFSFYFSVFFFFLLFFVSCWIDVVDVFMVDKTLHRLCKRITIAHTNLHCANDADGDDDSEKSCC